MATILIALVGCSGGGADGPQDLDGDGFDNDVDCNDMNPNVNPDGREVCDGVDNDCDGAIDDADEDVDVSGFATYFEDADGDGYGNLKSTTDACSPPEGFVANDADCDDTRVLVSPDQNEKCDGLDNDCSEVTPDAGVAFQQITGEWTNLTNAFREGSADQPSAVTLAQEGTLYVCEGNYFVSLNVEANVELRGLYGADRTVIDGGGVRPAVWIDNPVDVSLSGLTLRNGADSANTDGFGASLHCERRSIVEGEGLIIEGGPEMVYGGAVSALDECELSLTQSELRFGTADYGGLMYVSEATVTLEQVGFLDGRATIQGGGLVVGSVHTAPTGSAPSSVSCTGCSFQANASTGVEKTDGGGGVFLAGHGSLTIDGGLFNENLAAGLGGAVLIDTDSFGGATLDLTDVIFSKNADNSAKDPSDVEIPAVAGSYVFSDKKAVTLVCDEVSGCE